MSQNGEHVIEAEGLCRRFFFRTVLDRVTFAVPEGSICALVGSNGAGKTTTIHILLRMLRASGGSARVLVVEVDCLGPRELAQIGYVAADPDLPRWTSGRRYLRFLQPFYPTWDEKLCADLLERFEVPLERTIGKLSRGERARLAMVAGVAHRPELLFLDEPFGGLDPAARDDVSAGILEAAGEGGWSVLMASHDLDLVERLADRVIMLDRGRVLIDEPTEAILERFRRLSFTVEDGAPSPSHRPGSWIAAERSGRVLEVIDSRFDPDRVAAVAGAGELRAQSTRAMSLREIFVALTKNRGPRPHDDREAV